MRSNVVLCSECGKRLIKIVGEGFNTSEDTHDRFTFGRVCRKCNIIFLNPFFKGYEQKINKLGADLEKKKD